MVFTRREIWQERPVLSVYLLAGRIERGRIRLGEPHPESGYVEEGPGYRFVPVDGGAVVEARTLARLKKRLAVTTCS
jgi:predicted LPLAT superfamily acyltransferase